MSRSRSRSRAGSRARERSRSADDHSRSASRSSRGANGASDRGSRRSRSRSRSDSRSPAGPRSAKIVIEKLTKNVNEGHLHEIFGTYGTIEELEMPLNRQFLTNRGIAYVLYATPDDAERAIAHMHEAQLDGALINVSIVLPRRRFSRSPPARRPPPNRFGEAHRYRDQAPPDRGYRPGPPGRGQRSPPRRGDFRERNDNRGPPSRSYARSRSPRRRSPSYGGRSASYSRSPPPRRRAREQTPPRGSRRRSPSYSSVSDDSRDRRRSRDRNNRR
ncbi:hypothetical protein AMS68_000717 [Peltaster fructicola]|uniref:RRM domain-containing protein n=1 Tax=Peltaster fructicola TaxID=286661 RepID=A0A6H0XL22_9PEZI|nr:hypothetical protein AMS68_000717 [Peltaster fructicola]